MGERGPCQSHLGTFWKEKARTTPSPLSNKKGGPKAAPLVISQQARDRAQQQGPRGQCGRNCVENVWPPVCKVLSRSAANQSASTYPASEVSSRPRSRDARAPILINFSASCAAWTARIQVFEYFTPRRSLGQIAGRWPSLQIRSGKSTGSDLGSQVRSGGRWLSARHEQRPFYSSLKFEPP